MLTYERASELLRYEPETGKLYWKCRRQKIRIGSEAGSLSSVGRNTYRRIMIDGRLYLTHRIAWLIYYGGWPENQIDHCDGDGLNNRIENLRNVTQGENQKNQRMPRNNTSGFTGVFWHKQKEKWQSQIKINGKRKYLGRFDDIYEAASAYRKMADANGYTERHGGAV